MLFCPILNSIQRPMQQKSPCIELQHLLACSFEHILKFTAEDLIINPGAYTQIGGVTCVTMYPTCELSALTGLLLFF